MGLWVGGRGMGGGGDIVRCLPSITALQIDTKIIEIKYAGHPSGTLP